MKRTALALALICAPCAALAKDKVATEAFVDEFTTLDTKRWTVSDGWNNGPHQNCGWARDMVSVADGRLRIGFAAEPTKDRDHACGEIQSRARYGHGTYEVRLRTPAGSGLNAAFFTYIGPTHGAPHDEIDFEFLLKDTSRVQMNSYVAGQGGNEELAALPAPSDGGFHDYAFVWEPERIAFYVDGRRVHVIDDPSKVPTHPAKIFASLWGTDTLRDWMGPFASPERPLFMEIERVAFTPLGAPCPNDATACAPIQGETR